MKSKNKASEESKQSDAGKCKVNHGDSSGRAAAAEPEIDVKDMPDFGTHEDLSWWGFTKHAEAYCGKNMWLFLASQNLPGFNAAIESVKRGLMAFNAGNDEPAKGPIDFTEIFFTSLRRDPEESLKTYHTIVSSAAIRGDVEFFNRMQREIRKGKRRSDGNGLKFHLLTQWVHG